MAGIAILKNTLLFLTFAGLYALGRRLLSSRLTAGAAAASLLFVPQIAWEVQLDQSHSVLLMAPCCCIRRWRGPGCRPR